MTSTDFMLSLEPLSQERLDQAHRELESDPRGFTDNVHVAALVTIMQGRARGALQALLGATEPEAVRAAKARLDAYQQFFGEILQLQNAAAKKGDE